MVDVYLGCPVRTAIGRERGMFREVEPSGLAASVLAAQWSAPGEGDAGAGRRVVLANAVNGGNLARLAALQAGLPPSTPALTINEQCSGGLAAVRLAAEAVASGYAGLVHAGGVESVTHTLVRL